MKSDNTVNCMTVLPIVWQTDSAVDHAAAMLSITCNSSINHVTKVSMVWQCCQRRARADDCVLSATVVNHESATVNVGPYSAWMSARSPGHASNTKKKSLQWIRWKPVPLSLLLVRTYGENTPLISPISPVGFATSRRRAVLYPVGFATSRRRTVQHGYSTFIQCSDFHENWNSQVFSMMNSMRWRKQLSLCDFSFSDTGNESDCSIFLFFLNLATLKCIEQCSCLLVQ